MTKLRRLKINKLRNVEPVELMFHDGPNVLLGINGSGRTTLLELIDALSSQDLSKIRDEEFFVEYSPRCSEAWLDVRLENQQIPSDNDGTLSLLLAHRGVKGAHALKVRIRLRMYGSLIEYIIAADRVATVVMSRDMNTTTIVNKVFETTEKFDEQFLRSALEPILSLDERGIFALPGAIVSDRSLPRFDDSADFLRSILKEDGWIRTFGWTKKPEYHLISQRVATIPEALKEALYRRSTGVWASWRESDTISFTSHELPFLQAMIRLCKLQGGKLEMRLVEVEESTPCHSQNLNFGMLRFWFEGADGSILTEEELSYDQKRLLAFLYYFDCNPEIAFIDDLANGLDDACITECIASIGKRQAFLAIQNPLLLDELELELRYVRTVEDTFILCRCDTSSGKERLVWSNMTTHDAERFFEAYKARPQHVSEILRTEGLW